MSFRERAEEAVFRGIARGVVAWERLRTGAALDPLAPDYASDPHPQYARLRERDPVHRSYLAGGWVLSRFRDVEAVLRDPRFSADDRSWSRFERIRRRNERAGVWPKDGFEPTLLRLDAPDHTRLRRLVTKAFTPRSVAALEPRVEKLVAELLDAAPDAGGLDVVRQLAYPLPVAVIADLLGVPREDLARFKHWSDEVVRSIGVATLDDLRRARRAGDELVAYLEAIAEERRREPREDLISALLRAEEAGDQLTRKEVFSICVLLLVAGNETTTNLIGTASWRSCVTPSSSRSCAGIRRSSATPWRRCCASTGRCSSPRASPSRTSRGRGAGGFARGSRSCSRSPRRTATRRRTPTPSAST
jgi:cytochrome P450